MHRAHTRHLRLLALLGLAVLLVTSTGARAASAQLIEEPRISFRWSMPDRFGTEQHPSGVPDLTPSREFIHDQSRELTLDACRSSGVDQFSWSITALDFDWSYGEPLGGCRLTVVVPQLGRFGINIEGGSLFGGGAWTYREINVRDLVIVSLGDSLASGEGNPDVPSPRNDTPPVWEDTQCHRSTRSGPAQTALRLEQASRTTTVTFISLACSGATIDRGLLGPYKGQENTGQPELPPQVQQLGALLCRHDPSAGCAPWDMRPIDALLLQVGANDVGFGDIVENCAASTNPLLGGCDNDEDLQRQVERKLGELPGAYARLDAAVWQQLPISSVFLPEYFDPTQNQDGEFCRMDLIDLGPFGINGDISANESRWASRQVVEPLNHAVRQAALTHGWTLVGGMVDQFRPHGYCATDTWIVQALETKFGQLNEDGVLHPNGVGHQVYADGLTAAVRERLGV